MKIALAALLALTPVPAFAHHQQSGYSETNTCYREEYREEYVPGTADSPGYIKSWTDTIEYPCSRTRVERTYENTTRTRTYEEYDENDCTDGKIAGAIDIDFLEALILTLAIDNAISEKLALPLTLISLT